MADTKNAFDALKKGDSWNTARDKALGPKGIGNPTIISDVKEKIKGLREKNENTGLAIESAYNDILRDIKSTLNLPKKPKREDFINAAKKAAEISKVLEDAVKADTILDAELIGYLHHFIGIAGAALKENKPGLIGAAGKSVGSKMVSTAQGIVSGMASQLTEGIPFAPEMMTFVGAKIKGLGGGGGASSAQTDMAAKLQGGDIDTEGAEENGGVTSPIEQAKEELMGGESAGGGAGGGLEFTNELLINIDDNLQFIRDNSETAESRRERLRGGKAKIRGGSLVKKGKKGAGQDDGGGLFDTAANFAGSFLGSGGGFKGGLTNFFKGGKGAGLWSKILPKVLTVGRFIPIIGAIVAPLIDGIMGWFKADEWATTKSSAVIGAALGGTGSGASGAGWGALKGGMAGFAVGGPLGALAGVLIGAIAGWFGGERIAKALDAIGTFFSEKWNSFLGLFGKDDKAMTKRVKLKEMGEERIDLEKMLAEEEAKKGKSLEEVRKMAAAGKSTFPEKGQARRSATLFDADKVAKLQAQISSAKGEETRFMETGVEGSPDEIKARVAALPALIEEAKTKPTMTGPPNARKKIIGDVKLVNSLTEELNQKQQLLQKIPSGKEGLNLLGLDPNIPLPAILHGGEEVIEAEEVKALARITELAKELIEKYGKGAQYRLMGGFKNEKGEYQRIRGVRGGEGKETAERAITLMAKKGISEILGVRKVGTTLKGGVYGRGIDKDMPEEYGRNAPSSLTFLKDAMPELIEQFKSIKDSKLQLAEMKTGGVSIPFEVAMKNITGNQLNTAAMDKIGLNGSGGSSPTVVSADTHVTNNNSSTILPPIDPGGGMGRGLIQDARS